MLCKYASFPKHVFDLNESKCNPNSENLECSAASGADVHNSTVSICTYVNTQVSVGEHVLLQIVKISVRGSKGTAEVNILFDNGAD